MHQKVQIWVFSTQRCLLLKTNKDRGSFWQPVTGGVEQGETFYDAAWRELREETGINKADCVTDLLDTGYEFQFQSRWGGEALERVFVVAIQMEKEPSLDPKEHESSRWFNFDEVDSHLKYETNRKGLACALATLRQEKFFT